MPDVVFDPEFTQTGGTGYRAGSGPFYVSSARAIAIYTAGVLPADMEELICYNDIPGAIIPNAGLLLHFASWGGITIDIIAETVDPLNLGLITLTTTAGLALASGTAAEFLYYQVTGSTAAVPTRTTLIGAAIAGTVTTAAGSGDLIISNLSIVGGASYSISQWRHKVYQDFTY